MSKEITNAINSLKNIKSNSLATYIEKEFDSKKIAIYGAGGFGKEIVNVFLKHNLKPEVILDIKQTGELFNIPIIHPEKYKNRDVIVVLAIVLNKKTRNEIYDYLKKLGYENIIDAQTIRALYVESENGLSYEYIKSQQENILKPLNYLADEESKKTYTRNIIAHITRNYENTSETDELEQYFVKDIPFKLGFKHFIDCGAYIGDTFLKLCELNSKIEEYIGFEPIKETYKKLVENTKLREIKSIIFPSAVSDKTGIIKFNNMLGSSSMCESGDEITTCVKLDDVLHSYDPTFIKMDIEGEEIKALNGAKNIITNSRPELAICVYHYINHFWEIPNLLYSWNLGYKFYMRTHSSACMETVLYAVRGDN